MRMKKGDIIIIGLVLLFLGVAFFVVLNRESGEWVHITADGTTLTYPLSEDKTIQFGDDGSGNTIVIENHEVSMESADCPDQICVRHKPVSQNGESIICLPNRVFIEIEGTGDRELDN